MKLFHKILLFIIIIFLASCGFVYWYYNDSLNYTNPTENTIEIKAGEGIEVVADKLVAENIINSKLVFLVYSIFIDGDTRFRILPGIHTIPAGYNMANTLSLLVTNPEREITLTFFEGLTNQEIFTSLTENLNLNSADLSSDLYNYEQSNAFPITIPKNQTNLEGFLFPDTYRFKYQTTPSEVYDRIIENFSQKWTVAKIEKQPDISLSDYEILTLASIIEKEANSSLDEKRIISGIFYKRLDNGITLGANSTLNYILPEAKRVFTTDEINYNSPYNSYLNQGLPPSPICNPGLDSLIAAFDPEYTEYFYFLHSPDGRTYYSKTLDEHESNIEKYL